VVGTPRSGTTLLRLLLNNHPQIAIPDETNIMAWLYKRPGKPRLLLPKASSAGNLATAFGVDLATEYDALGWRTRPRSRAEKVAWFFSRYAHQWGKEYWGDKTPGHARYGRDLRDLFPESTILFVLRDPRAVIASFLRYRRSSARSQSDFWITDTVEEAVRSYRRFIRPGIDLAEYMWFVRYEDLVRQPVDTLRQICGELRVDFAPQMLEYSTESSEEQFFEGTSRRQGTLPEWKEAALRKIDSTLADAWMEELTDEEIAYVQSELSTYLHRFGYAEKRHQP
jgi:hypothetical protein